jgi:hypothetical protein
MLASRFHVLFALVVAIAGASAQNFSMCGQACVDSIITNGECLSMCDILFD